MAEPDSLASSALPNAAPPLSRPQTPNHQSIRPPTRRQTLIHDFQSWASVRGNANLQFDWDDAAGDAARRAAGLKLEKLRAAEIKRRRVDARGDPKDLKAVRMPGKNETFDAGDEDKGAAKKDLRAVRMPGKNETFE